MVDEPASAEEAAVRPAVELEAFRPKPWPGERHRPARVEDIVEWLQANPEAAVDVLGRLRVAGPWKDRLTGGASRSCPRQMPPAQVSQEPSAFEGVDPLWHWEVTTGQRGVCATRDAAKTAADAHLIQRGWSLAGGPHKVAP